MRGDHVKIVKNALLWIGLPSLALGVLSHSAAIPWLGWISVTGIVGSGVLIGWSALNNMSRCP